MVAEGEKKEKELVRVADERRYERSGLTRSGSEWIIRKISDDRMRPVLTDSAGG